MVSNLTRFIICGRHRTGLVVTSRARPERPVVSSRAPKYWPTEEGSRFKLECGGDVLLWRNVGECIMEDYLIMS
jgi:hypothetical protein